MVKKLKVDHDQKTKDPWQTGPEGEWGMEAKIMQEGKWTTICILIQVENELREIAKLVHDTGAEAISLTLNRDMYVKGTFLEQRERFMRAVTNMTDMIPDVQIRMTKE